MRAIKYPRYIGGNKSFEIMTGYMSSVYMAEYGSFHSRVIKNSMKNHLVNKVKKTRYYRRYIKMPLLITT